MELKSYQRKVINDLEDFFDALENSDSEDSAYAKFWRKRQVELGSNGLHPYIKNIKDVPSVCLKVPTGGGKTFLGINAIYSYFEYKTFKPTRMVVWLVPSLTILDQTLKAFKNPEHPYCQKLKSLFQNRVNVLTKDEAQSGTGLNPESLRTQVNILIISYDSFRAQNKEGRKVYQENGSLAAITGKTKNDNAIKSIENADETSLAQFLNSLNPLVIVDESHNAESTLSIEMLKNLNPSFVLELTATPKDKSNIISFVSAQELKKENMVKLPVIAYNTHDMKDVIINAINLREKLELAAIAEEKKTHFYIRPIALFQCEPKNGKEAETFGKLKERLISYGIPKEHIAIKTADINDLKNINLEDKNCPIRFILTVNALKEGWDCPFAYILGAIANRASPVNVEQILGRILRQPYTRRHENELLNTSFVLTSSEQFRITLQNIITALNRAGFSQKDYRVKEEQLQESIETAKSKSTPELTELLDALNLKSPFNDLKDNVDNKTIIDDITALAMASIGEYNQKQNEAEKEFGQPYASDAIDQMGLRSTNTVKIKEQFKDIAVSLRIPRFFIKADAGNFNFENNPKQLLSKTNLLSGFNILQQSSDISIAGANADIYKVDIQAKEYFVAEDEAKYEAENNVEYKRLNNNELKTFLSFVDTLPLEKQKREICGRVLTTLNRSNFDAINESDLIKYVERILDLMSCDDFIIAKENPLFLAERIKNKIEALFEDYAYNNFLHALDASIITAEPVWSFPAIITPNKPSQGLTKSLYSKEDSTNGFEYKVIEAVAALENVEFWHRNIERTGFCLNGWINHYPDFIVVTKKKNIILLETKGDDRDNSNSLQKLKLGKAWTALCGNQHKYFMVFDKNKIEGAYSFADFMDIVKSL